MRSLRTRRRARPPPRARIVPTVTSPNTPVPTPVKAKPDDALVGSDVPLDDDPPDDALVAAPAVVEVVEDVDAPVELAAVVVVVGALVVVDVVAVLVVVDDVMVVVVDAPVVVVVLVVAIFGVSLLLAADDLAAGRTVSATSVSTPPQTIISASRTLLTICLPVSVVLLPVGPRATYAECPGRAK